MNAHKRHQQDPDDPGAATGGTAASPAGEVTEPELVSDTLPADQVQRLLAERQELMNTLVRRQADFENYRKRVEKERHQDRHRGVEALVEQLLPILDAFDRALASQSDSPAPEYRRGFELIRRQLWDAVSKQGLQRIEAVGKEFDPNFHHAIESVETSEHAGGIVIDELQPGYVFHGRVLRPAMVRVAVELGSKSAAHQSN